MHLLGEDSFSVLSDLSVLAVEVTDDRTGKLIQLPHPVKELRVRDPDDVSHPDTHGVIPDRSPMACLWSG